MAKTSTKTGNGRHRFLRRPDFQLIGAGDAVIDASGITEPSFLFEFEEVIRKSILSYRRHVQKPKVSDSRRRLTDFAEGMRQSGKIILDVVHSADAFRLQQDCPNVDLLDLLNKCMTIRFGALRQLNDARLSPRGGRPRDWASEDLAERLFLLFERYGRSPRAYQDGAFERTLSIALNLLNSETRQEPNRREPEDSQEIAHNLTRKVLQLYRPNRG